MTPLPSHPRLRPVEIAPLDPAADGSRRFALTDPAGHLEAPLELSGAALLLLALCDGSRDHEAVRRDYRARTQQPLASDELADFLATMDRLLLLESERFRDHLAAQHRAWDATAWRPAVHAGGAYAGEPLALAADLDRWLAPPLPPPSPRDRLRVLIAPHLDFHRGGAGYGRAYARLRDFDPPDAVVLLGTAHAAEEGRFIVAAKGFETPLGPLALDAPLLERLERSLPRSYRRGELAHRHEHSLEFQAVWLAHLFRERPPTILPILATSFDDLFEPGDGPFELPETRDFLVALRAALHADARRVLVVVGADLAHVGPRFGDERKVDAAFLAEVRARDEAALAAVVAASPQRFLAAVGAHGNRDRICSVASTYAALFAADARRGELLVYDRALDPEGALAVTYAGAALFGDDGGAGLPPRAPPAAPSRGSPG